MSHLMTAIFSDSKKAGEAIGELKTKGYTNDISVIAKDTKDKELASHQVKQDVSDGAAAGAATGAAMGTVAGLLVGAASFVVPGVGLVVLGPLATILSGAAAGAVAGGITGTLVDWGIPDAKAKDYEHRIKNGEVLVAVSSDPSKESEIRHIFSAHQADDITQMHHG